MQNAKFGLVALLWVYRRRIRRILQKTVYGLGGLDGLGRGDPAWSPVTLPILRWLGYTTNSPINQHIQGFVHPLIVVRIANIAIPATACRG